MNENINFAGFLKYEVEQPVRVEICGHDTFFSVVRLTWEIYDLLGLKRPVPVAKKQIDQNPGPPLPFPSWRNDDRAVLAVKGSLTPQRTRP